MLESPSHSFPSSTTPQHMPSLIPPSHSTSSNCNLSPLPPPPSPPPPSPPPSFLLSSPSSSIPPCSFLLSQPPSLIIPPHPPFSSSCPSSISCFSSSPFSLLIPPPSPPPPPPVSPSVPFNLIEMEKKSVAYPPFVFDTSLIKCFCKKEGEDGGREESYLKRESLKSISEEIEQKNNPLLLLDPSLERISGELMKSFGEGKSSFEGTSVLIMKMNEREVYNDYTEEGGSTNVPSNFTTPNTEEAKFLPLPLSFKKTRYLSFNEAESQNQSLISEETLENQDSPINFQAFRETTYASFKNDKRRNIQNKWRSDDFEIFLEDIEEDGRSTLMIKNIPNKYDKPMILKEINKNFKDKYDFFYLPIDFTNRCNVGYAFINFLDFSSIRDFYVEFNGKKWDKFNSEKICILKYGRIQGKKSLAFHFANSTVMKQPDIKLKPMIVFNPNDMTNIRNLVERQKNEDVDMDEEKKN